MWWRSFFGLQLGHFFAFWFGDGAQGDMGTNSHGARSFHVGGRCVLANETSGAFCARWPAAMGKVEISESEWVPVLTIYTSVFLPCSNDPR